MYSLLAKAVSRTYGEGLQNIFPVTLKTALRQPPLWYKRERILKIKARSVSGPLRYGYTRLLCPSVSVFQLFLRMESAHLSWDPLTGN